jgi:protoheme IX farnesyltransferase
MLPVTTSVDGVIRQILIYTVLLWACSIALAPFVHLGVAYLVVAIVSGGAFFAQALTLLRRHDARRAMSLFGTSITYLTVLFVAMGVIAVIQHP